MPQGVSQNVARARAHLHPRRCAAVRAGAPCSRAACQAHFGTVRQAPHYGAQQDGFGVDLQDRASSPYAGGVN